KMRWPCRIIALENLQVDHDDREGVEALREEIEQAGLSGLSLADESRVLAPAERVEHLVDQGPPAEEEARLVQGVAHVEQVLPAEIAPPEIFQGRPCCCRSLGRLRPEKGQSDWDQNDILA